MNPLAQLKKAIPVFLVALVCFGLSPVAQALLPPPPPDGGYPGQNTAEGENALLSLTTGTDNIALGFQALYSNKVGFRNTATCANALFGSHGDGNANAINTAIWYLNNNVQICSADGPTLPSGWFLFEVGAFRRRDVHRPFPRGRLRRNRLAGLEVSAELMRQASISPPAKTYQVPLR
jgi:hypothetical protein